MHTLCFSSKTEEVPEFSVDFFPLLLIVGKHQGLAQSLSCCDTPGQAGRKGGERPINHNFFPVQWLHTTKYYIFCRSQAESCTVEVGLGAKLQRSLENRLQVTPEHLAGTGGQLKDWKQLGKLVNREHFYCSHYSRTHSLG